MIKLKTLSNFETNVDKKVLRTKLKVYQIQTPKVDSSLFKSIQNGTVLISRKRALRIKGHDYRIKRLERKKEEEAQIEMKGTEIQMKSSNKIQSQTQLKSEKPLKPSFRPAKDDTKPLLQDPVTPFFL